MNNKRLGTSFEREMVQFLRARGYWVHFLQPSAAGAQPFDILACKDGVPMVVECKTCVKPYIPISRLEENQLSAFDYWMSRGNPAPIIAVKYANSIYKIPYLLLKKCEKVYLVNDYLWEE